MTKEEKQQIVEEVLFLIRKNSKEVDQLPTAEIIKEIDNIEVSKGRKISMKTLSDYVLNFSISDYLDKHFLSSEHDDEAEGKITFKDLLKVGVFVDSLIKGSGIGIFPDGRIQTDRLEVRGSMSVMDLIINEIHAMAGEWCFSDCGKIEKVEVVNKDEHTYKIWIQKETDFDVTAFDTDDVLLSITNNLRVGGTDYYSSWFRPVMKNVEENSLTVVLYADSQVPGGTNFPPQAGFNVTRRGNALVPPKGETNERAQSWFLSSKEGRIAFLANVFKPIVEEYNYAVSIGKLPDVKALRNIDVVGDYGVYAKTIACEHLYEIDWNGDVVPNKVDRGEWSEEVANSDKPYRFINHDKVYPDGKHHYTELEQHTVFHFGCKWGCIVDKTKDEPKWNSQGWTMLEGDPNYYLEIESTNGYAFRPANVDTHLIAHIKYGNRDITDILIGTLGSGIEWFRETKNTAEDKTWHPTIDEGDKRNKIHVRRSDMGVNWVMGYREVTFICRVTIPVGENFEKVEQRIRFK